MSVRRRRIAGALTLLLLPGTAAAGATGGDPQAYAGRIAELERRYGPFHPQLAEALTGLGLVQQERGEYGAALETFRRALQIVRVNEGLHSPGQLDELERIIELQTALGDWEGLDDGYHYLYWVHRRSWGEDDPRLVQVLERLGRWHLQALKLGAGENPLGHATEAVVAFGRAVAIAERAYGTRDRRLVAPLYGLALASLRVAGYAQADLQSTWSHLHTSGRRLDLDFELERLQRLLADSYRTGRDALEQVAAIYAESPDPSPLDQATALGYLGDWYLLFDRRNDARETYASAYHVLRSAGLPDMDVDAVFAEPRPALALDVPLPEGASESAATRTRVVVSFDVNSSGSPRNIQVLEIEPAGRSDLARRAKQRLAATRFRPRLVDGQPVGVERLTREYVFLEERNE